MYLVHRTFARTPFCIANLAVPYQAWYHAKISNELALEVQVANNLWLAQLFKLAYSALGETGCQYNVVDECRLIIWHGAMVILVSRQRVENWKNTRFWLTLFRQHDMSLGKPFLQSATVACSPSSFEIFICLGKDSQLLAMVQPALQYILLGLYIPCHCYYPLGMAPYWSVQTDVIAGLCAIDSCKINAVAVAVLLASTVWVSHSMSDACRPILKT